jgi:hypothetical protein
MLVDILLSDKRFYTFEGYAAGQVRRIFEKKGIAHRTLVLSDSILHVYLSSLQERAPDWTLSFTSVAPFYDLIDLPHFCWVNEPSAPALQVLRSPKGMLGISDMELIKRLASKRAFFLPVGIEPLINRPKKCFNIVAFADLIDLAFLEKMCREDVKHSVLAQKTHKEIDALEGLSIDIFGEHIGHNWLVRLPSSVRLHSSLPYIEHFTVLSSSVLILAELSDQWYWPAIAAGCLPVVANKEQIQHYLKYPQEREKALESLRTQLSQHSWDKQVETLMQALSC